MTREEAYAAIRNADKAGDTESARKLAEFIQNLPDDDAPGQPLRVTVTDEGDGYSPEVDDSALNALGLGARKPLDNASKWVAGLPGFKQIDELGQYLGFPSAAGASEEADQLRQNNSRTGYQIAGNIAGTLPLAALPGGVLAQGAAGGALLSDADTAGGVAMDAALGAAGGKVGQVALRGLGQAVGPRLSQGLQTLINEGIRVSPGQLGRGQGGRLGNLVAAAEDKATSIPIVGDAIVGTRRAGVEQFGRATINRALEPIGQALPNNVRGRRAVAYAGDRLSEAYDAVLPRLRATGDQVFVDDLAAIHAEAAQMLPERARQFDNILQGLGRFWQDGVNLDGRALKEIETRIGDRVRRAAMSTDADQRELGDRLGDVLAAVRDLAARQNPDEAAILGQINRGWKSLTQVERAAANSKGAITPAGYSQAVRASSDTVRRRGYARGEALNQDLADAASEILPSQIPDSGTASRLFNSNLIGLGAAAATALPYGAAQGVTSLVTRQAGSNAQRLGDLIRLAAPRSGAQGAAIATGTIHSLGN